MLRFRKKSGVIEAMRYTGRNMQECADFCPAILGDVMSDEKLRIPTLEGKMIASVGDWIIKGVAGEFYPCKPDVFAKTYEPADA